ncbi:MAG: ABC transporter ATP-binding protein [Anaerolineae bacterium]
MIENKARKPVLETVNLCHRFGQVVVADDINVHIKAGERVGIVGPNGAGKTTFVNMITGHIRPQQGQILYMGAEITGLASRAITKLGIARSFQIPQLYISLSVRENVMIALAARAGRSLDFWNPLKRKVWQAEALEILEQFGLESYADRPVSVLPEGGRKLLDIALSFALKPRLLFMDEPTSGVSMQDKFGVMDTLVEVLQRTGVTTIFVEHDMDVVYRYAERVLVFSDGRIAADGDPQSLFADADIRRAVIGWEYRGKDEG